MSNSKMELGRASEYRVLAMLLEENREVYIPAVDDHGVDLIVRTRKADVSAAEGQVAGEGGPTDSPSYDEGLGDRRNEGGNLAEFQEIQVKSLSDGGVFAAIRVKNPRPNYWFIFYLQSINTFWLLNSLDFIKEASQNKKGKNTGAYSLPLAHGDKISPARKKYIVTSFTQIP